MLVHSKIDFGKKVTRTSPTEHRAELDEVSLTGTVLNYIAPADSVTTFTAI